MMQQSAESEIDRPTDLDLGPLEGPDHFLELPTRFSRKTENCVTDGQFRPCIVSYSMSLPPLSPKLMVAAPRRVQGGPARSGRAARLPSQSIGAGPVSGQSSDGRRDAAASGRPSRSPVAASNQQARSRSSATARTQRRPGPSRTPGAGIEASAGRAGASPGLRAQELDVVDHGRQAEASRPGVDGPGGPRTTSSARSPRSTRPTRPRPERGDRQPDRREVQGPGRGRRPPGSPPTPHRADQAGEQAHRRLADEPGHEPVRRDVVDVERAGPPGRPAPRRPPRSGRPAPAPRPGRG